MNEYNDKGEPHGYWETYHSGDKVKYKGNYINGLCNGYWEGYYVNGNIKCKVNFINGLFTECCEWYDSDGGIFQKEFYL
jgi:antitoxin component YwqK of YwqJK toxin-antitoxin module